MQIYQLSLAAVKALREIPEAAAKDVLATVKIGIDRDHPQSRYVLLRIKVDDEILGDPAEPSFTGDWSQGYLMMEDQTKDADLWSRFESRFDELDKIGEDATRPLYERAEAQARRAELARMWNELREEAI